MMRGRACGSSFHTSKNHPQRGWFFSKGVVFFTKGVVFQILGVVEQKIWGWFSRESEHTRFLQRLLRCLNAVPEAMTVAISIKRYTKQELFNSRVEVNRVKDVWDKAGQSYDLTNHENCSVNTKLLRLYQVLSVCRCRRVLLSPKPGTGRLQHVSTSITEKQLESLNVV